MWFGAGGAGQDAEEKRSSQLIDWFREAVLAPQVKAKLIAQALYPNPKCGADFAAHLRRQSELFTQLIRDLNIKTE